VVEKQIQACQDKKLHDDHQGNEEVCSDIQSLLFRVAHPKVFPVYVIGIVARSYLQRIAIILEGLEISVEGLEEEVSVVMVLERDKGDPYEMGEIEEEATVR
jgi:hypothetical protein